MDEVLIGLLMALLPILTAILGYLAKKFPTLTKIALTLKEWVTNVAKYVGIAQAISADVTETLEQLRRTINSVLQAFEDGKLTENEILNLSADFAELKTKIEKLIDALNQIP